VITEELFPFLADFLFSSGAVISFISTDFRLKAAVKVNLAQVLTVVLFSTEV